MAENTSRAVPSFGELIAADLKALGFGAGAPAGSKAPKSSPAQSGSQTAGRAADRTDEAFVAALMP
ncbi:MAG: hypothetical protein AAFZ05_00680, partial [Pseudomonadota bacterium]